MAPGLGLGLGLAAGRRLAAVLGFGWVVGVGFAGAWALAAAGLLAVGAGLEARLGGVPRGPGGGVLDEDVVVVVDEVVVVVEVVESEADEPQTPLHLPLLYRWERFRVIGARSSCFGGYPFFCPGKTGAQITNQMTVPQPGLARAVRLQRHLRCARNESTPSPQALAGETRCGVPC